MLRIRSILAAGLLLCAVTRGDEVPVPLGVFEHQSDVGSVLHPGNAEYDAATKTYTVTGSGENMWFASDEFHFVWKKISAQDVTITANISVLGDSGDGHRKGVLMIRQSLEGDSAYVDVARHGEGLTSLQFRDAKGAITREVESDVSGPDRVRLEKQGERFYMWIAGTNEALRFAGGSARVEIHAPFYVGIGVCAHRKDAVERAVFTNVDVSERVTHPAAKYSTVETVLQSGDARVGFVSTKHLTSPGWSEKGDATTYDGDGVRELAPFVPLRTASPVGAPVTAPPGAPFDYTQIEQMASDGFRNASPHLSPDGKNVVFLSYPADLKSIPENGEVTLRMMSVADKKIKTLATFFGGPDSLGKQPWSPDGRRAVFVSYQAMGGKDN